MNKRVKKIRTIVGIRPNEEDEAQFKHIRNLVNSKVSTKINITDSQIIRMGLDILLKNLEGSAK